MKAFSVFCTDRKASLQVGASADVLLFEKLVFLSGNLKLAASLVISLSAISPTFAAEPLYSTYFEAGQKYFNENRYVDSLKQLETALENAEHLPPQGAKIADLYDLLGQAYSHTGNQRKAQEFLGRALEIRENNPALKKDDIKLFGTIMLLGTVYRNQNKFAESETLYKKGLALFQGNGPIKYLCQSTVLYALGTLYLERAKGSEAEVALKEALRLRDKTILKAALKEQGIFDALGRAYQMQGRLSEAETILKKALEIAKSKKDESGVFYSQANLALVYIEQSRYKEARELIQASINMVDSLYGQESNQMATLYSNLAEVAIAQDRYEEAESLLNKALAIHVKQLGDSHTSVGFDKSKIVSVLRNQGRYGDAENVARSCITIFSTALGADNQNTGQAYKLLADVLIDQKRYDEALQYQEKALKCLEAAGLNQEKAETLMSMAEVKVVQGKTEEALSLYSTAAGIMESGKDSEPVALARLWSDLAQLKESSGDQLLCAQYLQKALAVREKVFGLESPRTVADLKQLIKVLHKLGKEDEIKPLQARLDAILVKNPDLKGKNFANLNMPIKSQNDPTSPKFPVKSKWALVIGISNFQDSQINLKYAAKDATDFSQYLIKEAGFASDHVKLLTDKDATRENIIKQLGGDWLGRRAASDDLVVVYISSHGSTSKSEAGGVNFLVAHDTQPEALLSSGIPMQWLSQMIKEQVHSRRVILVLDVCHSGAVHGTGGTGASGANGEKGLVRQASFDLEKVALGEGQAIICSSAPEQVSWESKTYPNSVFTRKLIESLRLNGGKVNLNEAFDNLKESVEREVLSDRGKLQTPVYFSKGWQGPPPVLSVPVKE